MAVKRSAAVLLEGLARHEQRQQLALRDLHGGEGGDRVRVAVRVDAWVELDRQIEPVAHEGDVAHDRLARDLEALRELRAIGEGAAAELLVDAEHALDGRTGKLGVGRHRLHETGFLGWDK